MIKEGVYTDLSSEEYHSDKDSISRSSLKDFNKNPYYYWAKHVMPDRPVFLPTVDMILGSAFHTFVLENDKFHDQYIIEPPKVLLKEVGREKYDAHKVKLLEIELSKKIVLSNGEYNTLECMLISLMRNPKVKELLEGSEIEKSFFWKDKASGLMCKARPDILQKNMIIDLKTIADASFYSFQRDMASGWYHVQGGMIRDAIWHHEQKDISTVINICVEKKYPFCVAIYIIDEPAIEAGQALYKSLLQDLSACIINNDFPDYKIETVGLPRWAQ